MITALVKARRCKMLKEFQSLFRLGARDATWKSRDVVDER